MDTGKFKMVDNADVEKTQHVFDQLQAEKAQQNRKQKRKERKVSPPTFGKLAVKGLRR